MTLDEKYYFYEKSVQNVDFEVDFLELLYKKFFLTTPQIFREDFSGSSLLSLEYSKRFSQKAFCIDLDPEPLNFGKKRANKWMTFCQEDVVQTKVQANIIAAFNFSYCIFKKRSELLKYFINVKKTLLKEGFFILDFFGGNEAFLEIRESKKISKEETYYWECEKFNALNQEGIFSIHYKKKSQPIEKRVFSYDWRLWSPVELRDLLEESGFKNISFYLEEDDEYVLKQEETMEGCFLGYLVAR
jgi:hypothetical protein